MGSLIIARKMSEPFIIATSDWHFGKRQYGLKFREHDRYAAGHALVDYAIKHQVPAILNGGDTLDVTRPSSKAVSQLKEIHNKLVKAKIPMYVVQGNHDRVDPPWYNLFDAHPEFGVQLIGGRTVEIAIGTKKYTLAGIDEKPKDQLIKAIEEVKHADILLLHASVQEWIGFPSATALSLQDDIPKNRFRLVVIGDTHIHDYRELEDGTAFLSPGAIENGTKAEPREFHITRLGSTLQYDTVPLPTRPVVDVYARTDDELKAADKTLQKLRRGTGGLAYLYYNPKLENTSILFAQTDAPEYYLTPIAIQEEEATVENVEDATEGKRLMTIGEFAAKAHGNPLVNNCLQRILLSQTKTADLVEELCTTCTPTFVEDANVNASTPG